MPLLQKRLQPCIEIGKAVCALPYSLVHIAALPIGRRSLGLNLAIKSNGR